MFNKGKELIFGKAKNPLDQDVFHKISLIAFLAWVGLGADGLSSSAYGPEEAFRALGGLHQHLAIYLALATAFTVFIISASYSQIIELFPSGGGGYVVATKLLGEGAGLVSGNALIVDYILTISISIAAAVDAVFSLSFMPGHFSQHKVFLEGCLVLLLIWLNMRGIKESIKILLPIFIIFILTHILLIVWGICFHFSHLPTVAQEAVGETADMIDKAGFFGFLIVLFRAYSLGGGTYTGIEAVSNGLAILREPRVKTGKRTMLYMATSLAFTAGGILLCYMLWDIKHIEGSTMNGSLAESIFRPWKLGAFPLGGGIIALTLLSEGLLLIIAAQTGFVDGPNVLSNLAVDSWVPHRFANLSNRLVRQNGVLLMGVAALFIIWLTRGEVSVLVVLYSINVFLTFTLSQLSMCVHWWQVRREQKDWPGRFAINGLGLILTLIILIATTCLKFSSGGWVTLVITGSFIAVCLFVRRYYNAVNKMLKRLDDMLVNLPLPETEPGLAEKTPSPEGPTAVLMVREYGGLGIHSIFSIRKLFGDRFKNFIFISVGRIDSSQFKGVEELKNLGNSIDGNLRKYADLARRMGYCSGFRYTLGTDVITEMEHLCDQLAVEFNDPVFFSGKLVFDRDNFISRVLHNQTSLEIQRKLLFKGLNMVVVPIRVF